MDLSKNKIDNLYPTEQDLYDSDIATAPHVHFHCSYYGLQLYLIKSQSKYIIKSMNFVPSFIKTLDYDYIISHTYLELYSTHDFDSAVYMFQKCVSDLLYTENVKHLSKYDISELSPMKYPNSINILRKVFC